VASSPFSLGTAAIGNVLFVYLMGVVAGPFSGILIDRYGKGLALTLLPNVVWVVAGRHVDRRLHRAGLVARLRGPDPMWSAGGWPATCAPIAGVQLLAAATRNAGATVEPEATTMSTDQLLIVIAISAYIVGTLALLVFFLSRDRIAKLIGIPFAVIGSLTQFAELVYRYQTSHIWPLTNLYGSLSLFSALSVAIFLGFAWKYDLWAVGGFVQMFAAGFLAYALTWNEGYLPAVPALQSYWIKVHVPLVIAAYATFMVAFSTSIMYLIKYYVERYLDRPGGGASASSGLQPATASAGSAALRSQAAPGDVRRSGNASAREALAPSMRESPAIERAAAQGSPLALWAATMPPLAKLDILTYRIVALGLPLLTVGIITGAWWAKEAWGAYWQWDPKETAALTSWIVYAMYMHLHTRSSWRGLRSAWMSVFGFITIIFCYLGVNIWISGLHSYKM